MSMQIEQQQSLPFRWSESFLHMEAACSEVDAPRSDGREFADEQPEVSQAVFVPDLVSKRARTVLRGRSSPVQLDTALWSTLDDYLVEKIIAKLPFKSFFQAPLLSKAWCSKFLCLSFQNEVRGSSSSWTSYAPLFVNNYMEMIGYDSVSKLWHELPTLSYLPVGAVDWNLRAGCGSLLCWTTVDQKKLLDDSYNPGFEDREYQVFISNPLTKQWKQLPPRPDMRFPHVVHVVCPGSKAYVVILVSEIGRPGFPSCALCVQIFDSSSSSWKVEYHPNQTFLDVGWGCSAYVNGVLYMLGRRDGFSLTSFTMQDSAWKHVPNLYRVEDVESVTDGPENPHLRFRDVRFSHVVVCRLDVMLVVLHKDGLSVCRLDLQTGSAVEVSKAPSEMLWAVHFCTAAGQGDCIYIGRRCPSFRSIVYNLKEKEWHWVPCFTDRIGRVRTVMDPRYNYWLWTSVTYEPGLNPFLDV